MYIYIFFLLIGFASGTIVISLYKKREIHKKNEEIQQAERSKDEIIDLVEHSKDIIYYFRSEPEYEYLYLSPSVNKVLGWDIVKHYENPEEIFAFIHPEDYPTLLNKIHGKVDFSRPLLQRWKHIKGHYIWFEETARPVYENGVFIGVQGILRNITEKIALQKKLEYQSLHDELTGLSNRYAFRDRVSYLNNLSDSSVGLLVCDMNNLKNINDTHGHVAGDQSIQHTAEYLITQLNEENQHVYRIGGDEFVIITTDISETDFTNFCAQITNSLKQNAVNISVGNAYATSSKGKMDELFKMADKSMYNNKKVHKKSPTLK
ncbi:sensor domain-containing diguanylate cyclase [Salipaludibacillus keqinensis]|uniref:sensor domain-containing diguanylate cyclase n=1 Tax=Salipaludibacillus keqinensis TaxID=2045207 RepID=UPI001304D545|nr:GGDEF domain-containing protein [Salipaludibacillus keqinensis]